MGRYGLIDEGEDDSFGSIPQTRKRTYPDAFPEENSHAEIYPYNIAIPVSIEGSQEWMLPFALTMGSVMDCFKTSLGWIRHVMVEYGGRFFTAGKFSLRHGRADNSWFVDREE
jgi:hypothetical protein